MPIKLSKYKQSIFDIVAENFGNLNYIVKVSSENARAISDILNTNTSLIINNSNLGDSLIKEAIANNLLIFNNNYVSIFGDWILTTGFWDDLGKWIDTETWID